MKRKSRPVLEPTPVTITMRAFLANPAEALRLAEVIQVPITILGDDGKPSAFISAPRDGINPNAHS
jgi:hypothetical protein